MIGNSTLTLRGLFRLVMGDSIRFFTGKTLGDLRCFDGKFYPRRFNDSLILLAGKKKAARSGNPEIRSSPNC
jgi:hypothetical protein